MSILLAIFVIILLLSIRPVRLREYNSSYLSMENTTLLRGVLAVSIILHHMSEKLPDGVFGQLQHIGYMIVAIFFFLSGYGLMLQYTRKGKDYLKGFWTKRILYLLIIYILVSVVYIVFRAYIICDRPIDDLLHQFLSLEPVAVNSWYIIVQLLFYVFFWLAFKLCVSAKCAIGTVFLLTATINIVFIVIGLPSIWYISNFAFPLGLIWSLKEREILANVKSHYFLWLLCAFLVFMVGSAFPGIWARISVVDNSSVADIVTWISRMVSSCAITLTVIIAMLKFRFVGFSWKIIGKMSLDIYLLHAIAYMVLRSKVFYIDNPVVWTLCTLTLTFMISFVGNKVSSSVHSYLKKI